ncbi:MAG: 3-oxoacyl-(Acyl-carrier-protein) reductase [candidate division TM6 bacterium GW2011_GWF2_37_49]|nr:MAG: 3-oxoacyl-(Acyl-carrier-protein) reductase [candidate division TM6 bacterium GW2011_GWF2_37_49]
MAQFNSIVTGGVQGIGKSIVAKLLSRGDNVFVFDCVDSSNDLVREIQQLGSNYVQTNITSVQSIKTAFDQVFTQLGNSNLDLLVNNAGVTKDNIAIRLSEQDWDLVLDVNLKGNFFCSQHAIKKMMQQPKSYIINISSIVALHGNAGQANYAASKAGIIALTKTLAQEYGSRNILINSIAPGFIQTKMTEKLPNDVKNLALQHIALKKFGAPDDVSNLVDFLSSGKADYITGQTIEVTGGMR